MQILSGGVSKFLMGLSVYVSPVMNCRPDQSQLGLAAAPLRPSKA